MSTRKSVRRISRRVSTRAASDGRRSFKRSLCMQSLEDRRVLSAVSLLEGGVLTIQADDEPNQIVAWANKDTDTLVIQVDETKLEFTDSLVRRIDIFGNGGGDTIGIRDSVTQPTVLDGGNGADTIVGSQQSDVIVGGPGNDRLSGRGGSDRIDGGLGNDAIGGGEGSDAIKEGLAAITSPAVPETIESRATWQPT